MSNSDCNGNGAAKITYEDYDLKHIFQVAEQILVKRESGQYGRSDSAGFFTGIMDQYGSIISDVSREMTCKLSESEDEKTCKILNGTLRNHSLFKAKMVIAVAAFALKCGKHLIIPSELPDFDEDYGPFVWSDHQRTKSGDNSIIKSIWLLQRLHIIYDQIDKSQPLLQWLKGLQYFVQRMMRLTRYILYEARDDQVPEADFQWIIKSAVVCSSQITAAHLLLLSNREKLFQIHALKLEDLTQTVKKTSKLWEIAQRTAAN